MTKFFFLLSACLLLLAHHAFAQEEAQARHGGLCSNNDECHEDEQCVSGLCESVFQTSLEPELPTTPESSAAPSPSDVLDPAVPIVPPSSGSAASASPSALESPVLSSPEGSVSASLSPSPSMGSTSPFPPQSSEPEPSDEDSSVCVDVKYLTALGHTTDELVHSSHILTNTLCPGNGLPCGTANHMVRMNGQSLSYKQLCERVVCTKKTMAVNSVYTHVWEEKMHGDVALTMYDARHPEMMQRVLHRVSQAVRKITA